MKLRSDIAVALIGLAGVVYQETRVETKAEDERGAATVAQVLAVELGECRVEVEALK